VDERAAKLRARGAIEHERRRRGLQFGFVKSQLDLIAQLREAMRRAKFEADDAVRRAQFHRALEIMESLTQNKLRRNNFRITQKN
jgi:hypothetical protein